MNGPGGRSTTTAPIARKSSVPDAYGVSEFAVNTTCCGPAASTINPSPSSMPSSRVPLNIASAETVG